MRTAKQWQDELDGETSVESIRAIQEDALAHAMKILTNYKQSRGEAVAELTDLICNPQSAHRKS